jgi:hypothetical protein
MPDSDLQSYPVQAMRAYLAIIGYACQEQFVKCRRLSELTGRDEVGRDQIFDRLGAWLAENDLPNLTAIVINEADGEPGCFEAERGHPYAVTRKQ